MDLNHARLPIPPLRHGKEAQRERLDEQQFLGYRTVCIVSIMRHASHAQPTQTYLDRVE
jgi:hypothetical protein